MEKQDCQNNSTTKRNVENVQAPKRNVLAPARRSLTAITACALLCALKYFLKCFNFHFGKSTELIAFRNLLLNHHHHHHHHHQHHHHHHHQHHSSVALHTVKKLPADGAEQYHKYKETRNKLLNGSSTPHTNNATVFLNHDARTQIHLILPPCFQCLHCTAVNHPGFRGCPPPPPPRSAPPPPPPFFFFFFFFSFFLFLFSFYALQLLLVKACRQIHGHEGKAVGMRRFKATRRLATTVVKNDQLLRHVLSRHCVVRVQ